LNEERRRAELELSEATRATDEAADRIKSLADLHTQLRKGGDDSTVLRLRLRAELRRLMAVVRVYPVAVPVSSTPLNPQHWEPDDEEDEAWLRQMARVTRRQTRPGVT